MTLCKEAGRTSSAGLLGRPGEVARQCLGELHKAEDDTHGHGHSSAGPLFCIQTWSAGCVGKRSCAMHMMALPLVDLCFPLGF